MFSFSLHLLVEYLDKIPYRLGSGPLLLRVDRFCLGSEALRTRNNTIETLIRNCLIDRLRVKLYGVKISRNNLTSKMHVAAWEDGQNSAHR